MKKNKRDTQTRQLLTNNNLQEHKNVNYNSFETIWRYVIHTYYVYCMLDVEKKKKYRSKKALPTQTL